MEKEKVVGGNVLILLWAQCVYYRHPLLRVLGWLLLAAGLICFILRLLWRRRGLILGIAIVYFLFCNA